MPEMFKARLKAAPQVTLWEVLGMVNASAWVVFVWACREMF